MYIKMSCLLPATFCLLHIDIAAAAAAAAAALTPSLGFRLLFRPDWTPDHEAIPTGDAFS